MHKRVVKLDAIKLKCLAVLSCMKEGAMFTKSGRVLKSKLSRIATIRLALWSRLEGDTGNDDLERMTMVLLDAGIITTVTEKTVVFASWLLNLPSVEALNSAVLSSFKAMDRRGDIEITYAQYAGVCA